MTNTTQTNTPKWVLNRILAFFNEARSIEDILDGTIQDDPSDGPGRTLGPTLAARILREKSKLPRRRFIDFEQLDSIKGVGEGTIQDLAYTFGTPAAEAFQQGMYDNNIIYPGNWKLEYFRYVIDDKKAFNDLINNESLFRAWVLEKMAEICSEKGIQEEKCQAMLDSLSNAYIDNYHNSTQGAAFALALWFYEFDADNWFSWEQIQQQCLSYFDYHMGSFPWYMELRFFKGFLQKGIIPNGITPPDLPVVVNYPERAISFWVSALYD